MTLRSASPLLVVFTVVATSCTALSGGTVGSGHPVTEQRDVDGFSRIEVGEAIRATVIVGPAVAVSVTADDNVLGSVETTVIAGRLKIGMNGNVSPRTAVEVAVTVPSLEEASANSAANVTITGLNAGSFSAAAESAASLVVRGNADSISVSASSAASADMGDVPAQTASVDVSSAARATVNAQLSVSGSVDSGGSVAIEGDPQSVNVSTDSGGAVNRD
jgi:hypothetical protein